MDEVGLLGAEESELKRERVPDRVLRVFEGHKGGVHRVRFVSSGHYCISAGSDGTVKLWNPTREEEGRREGRGKLVHSFDKGHVHSVFDVVATVDGSRLYSVGKERLLVETDVERAEVIRRLRGHTEGIFGVDTMDALVVTGSGDATVRLWDVRSRSRESIQTLPRFGDVVRQVVLTGDGRIGCGCLDGSVQWFDVRKGTQSVDVMDRDAGVTSLCVDRVDADLYLCGMQTERDASARLVQHSTGLELGRYNVFCGAKEALGSALSTGATLVLVGDGEGTLHVFDSLLPERPIHSLKHHLAPLTSIHTHPCLHLTQDQPRWLTAAADGSIALWATTSEEPPKEPARGDGYAGAPRAPPS